MRRSTLAVLIVLLCGTAARADQISWPYNRVSSPTAISADAGPSGIPRTGTDSMHISGTQLGLNTSADRAAPDHFTNKASSLNLTLTNAAPSAKNTMTFAGRLNATMSAQGGGGVSASTYTAALGSSRPPTPSITGGFGAEVTPACVLVGGPPPTQPPPSTNAPEPSACVLAGLGASLAVLFLRRKPGGGPPSLASGGPRCSLRTPGFREIDGEG